MDIGTQRKIRAAIQADPLPGTTPRPAPQSSPPDVPFEATGTTADPRITRIAERTRAAHTARAVSPIFGGTPPARTPPRTADLFALQHRAKDFASATLGDIQRRLDIHATGAPRELCDAVAAYPWDLGERADDIRRLWYLLNQGCWCVLIGDPGTGKTETATRMLWYWAMRQGPATARYVRAIDLLDRLKRECYQEGDSRDEALARWIRMPLLVIDEVDKAPMTADTRQWYEVMLGHRFDTRPRHPTLFISNDTTATFRSAWDAHMRDRIMARPDERADFGGAVFEWKGDSHRRAT